MIFWIWGDVIIKSSCESSLSLWKLQLQLLLLVQSREMRGKRGKRQGGELRMMRLVIRITKTLLR